MIKQFLEYIKNVTNKNIKVEYDEKGNLVLTKELTELLKQYLSDKKNNIVINKEDLKIAIGEDLPNSPYYEEEPFKTTEDLVAVHITEVIPLSDTILTKENGGVVHEVGFRDPTTGISHIFEYPSGNDTVHLTLNSPVRSHAAGNDWNSYLYGVLINFKNLDKEKVLDVKSEDTYVDGNLELGDNYFLFCPKGEREKIQRLNPNATVIEYDGISLQEAISSMILLIGKKLEPYGTYAWGRNEEYGREHPDVKKLEELVTKEGYPVLKGRFGNALHSETKYKARRMWKKEYEALIRLLEYNKKNGVDMPDEAILSVLAYSDVYNTPGVLEVTLDNFKEYVLPILKKHNYEVDESLCDGLFEETGLKIVELIPGYPIPSVQFAPFEDELRERIIKMIKKSLYSEAQKGGGHK